MEPVELKIITRNETKKGLEEIVRDTGKVGQTVEQVTADFKARMKEQSEVVKQVEADIKSLEKQVNKASPGKAKMELTADLEAAKKVLAEEKGELDQLEKQVEQSAQKHITLRTEIRNLKQEMAGMTEGTEEYASAMRKLGEMEDRMGDIGTQGRIFADDNKNIKATMDAVSGLTGVMTAGVGVASLFGMEQEKLAEIQTKLQAVMAITMGVQQVANTLNKDSYFTHVLLAKGKTLLAAANTRLAVSLGISNVAAKALMATLTLGLSAVITGLIVLWERYSTRTKKAQSALNIEVEKTKTSLQQISDGVDFETRIAEAAGKSKKELIELRKEVAKTALALADASFDEINIKFMKGDASKEQMEAARENAKSAWDNYNKVMQDAIVNDYQERTDKKKKTADNENKTDAIADAELKARQKINDMTIALMKEGEEKKKKQARKQFDDEMARIDQEERERMKALQNAQKNGMSVTPEQVTTVKTQAKQQRDLASEQYIKDFYAVEKEYADKSKKLKSEKIQALIEYNKEYGTYEEKRLAIEMEYNEKVADIQEKRREAEKNGDAETVERMDIALAKATKDKGKSLMNMDYEQLKESPEYVRAFENLRETSSETLNSLLSQFENAKQTAAKVLSPDQLREYTTTIQEIMDELDSRNPFQSLTEKKQELAEAEQELANAQLELENARRTAEAVKGGTQIENGISSSKFNAGTGKIESTKAYLTEAQALEKVKEKTNEYNASKDKVVKKSAQVKKSEKDVKEQIDELSSVISDVGKAIGGPAGEIISLIGDIGTFTMTAMSGVEAAADTSAEAISTVEKASVILAIISAAMQVATKIFDMFGGDNTTEKYEQAKEAYESYINILDRVIEKHLELAETLTGENANAAYEKAIETIKLQSENAKILGKQYLNSGASGKSHSKGYNEVDDMSSEGWKQAANVLGMSIDQFKKKMGGRMTGLFDLTDEQLASLQENAGIFWSQLDSDTQNYADQIASGVAKVAEVIEQKMSDTTLLDVDTLRSDFQDLLADMDSDTSDFAENFEEYMRNAIVNSMLKEEFMQKLKLWREKFYNAMGGGVTEDEYADLKAEGQQLTEEMKKRRDELAEMYGWSSSSSDSQSGRAGAVTTITEETAGKLEGIATSMQIHLINMDDKMTDIAQYAYEAIGVLNIIAENTAFCKFLEDIADAIEKMERDGVKMK